MSKSPDQTRELLHSFGLRYSKPREIILDYFGEKDRHTNVEALYEALKERGHHLSLSTLYLNLAVLKNAGLVRELRGSSGEAIFDSNIRPHHHLVCENCGEVTDVFLAGDTSESIAWDLKNRAERATGWYIKEPSLEFQGLCPSCQQD
ncbi:MAG: transcriptional repressor [Trueperaceae bacterium]|nr:transcriptional repressor [Trueperaceae bacterium]